MPFLEESLNNLRERVNTVLPDLHAEPAEWFRFWDEVSSDSVDGRRQRQRGRSVATPA